MNASLRPRAAVAAAMAPLAIALCLGPQASASPSAVPTAASEQDGCESSDDSPQSCIQIIFSEHHLQTIKVGVGSHVRGGPYTGQYNIWDSAKKFSLHTGTITFRQNKSFFLGHTMWGPSYTNSGAGWTVPKGDTICGQFTQTNGEMSHPACATVDWYDSNDIFRPKNR